MAQQTEQEKSRDLDSSVIPGLCIRRYFLNLYPKLLLKVVTGFHFR